MLCDLQCFAGRSQQECWCKTETGYCDSAGCFGEKNSLLRPTSSSMLLSSSHDAPRCNRPLKTAVMKNGGYIWCFRNRQELNSCTRLLNSCTLLSMLASRPMQTGLARSPRWNCLPSSPAASSYAVIAFTVLLGDTARGILWPTLYPLVTELGGSSLTLGGAVAAFSVGRVAGSPMLGWCSVRWGVAATLQWSLALFAVGAVMYALVSARINCTV